MSSSAVGLIFYNHQYNRIHDPWPKIHLPSQILEQLIHFLTATLAPSLLFCFGADCRGNSYTQARTVVVIDLFFFFFFKESTKLRQRKKSKNYIGPHECRSFDVLGCSSAFGNKLFFLLSHSIHL